MQKQVTHLNQELESERVASTRAIAEKEREKEHLAAQVVEAHKSADERVRRASVALQQEQSAISERLNDTVLTLDTARNALAKAESDRDAMRSQTSVLEDRLRAAERDAEQYRAAASRAQEERMELEDKLDALNASGAGESKRLKTEVERLKTDHANEVSRLRKEHGEELAKVSSSVSAAHAETDAVRRKLDAAESGHRAELATAARERASLQDTLAEVRRELDTAQREKEALQRDIDAAGAESARLKAKLETALSDRSTVQAENDKLRVERDNLSRVVGRQRREIESVRVAVGAPSRVPNAPSQQHVRSAAVSFAVTGAQRRGSVSEMPAHPLYEDPSQLKINPSMTGATALQARRDTNFIEEVDLHALARSGGGNDASLSPFMGFLGRDAVDKLPEVEPGELLAVVTAALETAKSGTEGELEAVRAEAEAAEKREAARAEGLLKIGRASCRERV